MTNITISNLPHLSDEQLRAIVIETRNNPPANWDECRIYDTPVSYEACMLLGRRRFFSFFKA